MGKCVVCGWPLAAKVSEGCTVGNCSTRVPDRPGNPLLERHGWIGLVDTYKASADAWKARAETAERERDEARAEVLRTVRELNDSRTETEQAAATERAKIVLYLTGRQYAAHRGDDAARARAFDDAARDITRLDHHRDGGG